MPEIKLIKPERVNLLKNPILTEKRVQDIIANDPSILGLGDLIMKDKERIHAKAGRLDLLLQDAELERRYEVEIQLGKVDESHIIRTIEYRDIERKRYPQYDHVAVIIAEDITNRFLNVINLLNGTVPFIAIQMNAFKYEDKYRLNFTTVLHEVNLGDVEEEDAKEVTDRAYREKRGSSQTVALADDIVKLIDEFAAGYELKYNKFYIGLAKDGMPDNFVIFKARKAFLIVELRLDQSDEVDKLIEDAGLDFMEYDNRWNRYRIRIEKADLKENKDLLVELLKRTHGK